MLFASQSLVFGYFRKTDTIIELKFTIRILLTDYHGVWVLWSHI